MKDLSVSTFKATLSACLREVQDGETLVITEHRRPIAEVIAYRSQAILVEPALGTFTLADSAPRVRAPGLWTELLDEERGEY